MKVFVLTDFLAWLATKPREGVFNYNDSGQCAAAQFIRERTPGLDDVYVYADSYTLNPASYNRRERFDLPAEVHAAMLAAQGRTKDQWLDETAGKGCPISWGAAHDALAEQMKVVAA